jgi:hypothetical protein
MPFNSESAKQAGQKSRRGEAKLTKLIRDIVDTDNAVKVFKQLEEQALSGDLDATKLYLSYVIGKPKEFVDITTDGEKINSVLVEVIKTNAATGKD